MAVVEYSMKNDMAGINICVEQAKDSSVFWVKTT